MKHPAGTLALAKRLQELSIIEGNANEETNGDESRKGEPPAAPTTFIRDLQGYDFDQIETPSFVFMESTAGSVFQRATEMASGLTTEEVKVTNAYSIKTNPDEKLISLALDSGFLAEAISLLELQKALRVGYRPEQVVLNGPGKWWPNGLLPEGTIHAVFADSIADLKYTIGLIEHNQFSSHIVGVRLRTPGSRFGIPLDDPEELATLVDMIKTIRVDCKFGIHFHMASSNIGIRQWWHLYEAMLRWAKSVEKLTQRKIYCLDIGGGWFPDDWHTAVPDRFERAIQSAKKFLPRVEEIISEPGKAIAQPANALAMRVLEFESGEDEIDEVVVDGSIAELPMNFFQPHRIFHYSTSSGQWTPLARGNTRLLGRLCMEHDIVASNVQLPPALSKGDVLVFCDAGAYDRSMSYVFGRG
jgi:diaminopimelate decarboxylase